MRMFFFRFVSYMFMHDFVEPWAEILRICRVFGVSPHWNLLVLAFSASNTKLNYEPADKLILYISIYTMSVFASFCRNVFPGYINLIYRKRYLYAMIIYAMRVYRKFISSFIKRNRFILVIYMRLYIMLDDGCSLSFNIILLSASSFCMYSGCVYML